MSTSLVGAKETARLPHLDGAHIVTGVDCRHEICSGAHNLLLLLPSVPPMLSQAQPRERVARVVKITWPVWFVSQSSPRILAATQEPLLKPLTVEPLRRLIIRCCHGCISS